MDIFSVLRDSETVYSTRREILLRGTSPEDGEVYLAKVLFQNPPSSYLISQLRYEYTFLNTYFLKCALKPVRFDDRVSSLILYRNQPGVCLTQLLAQHSFLIPEKIKIATHLAKTLEEIHGARIIHNGLSTDTILVHPDTFETTLTTFCYSKGDFGRPYHITSDQWIGDFLPFVSPERTGRVNRPIDFSSDCYSLGIIYYVLFTGQLPFRAHDPNELIHHHLAVVPEYPSKLVSEIPDVLSKIIMKLLSKEPGLRYQTVSSLLSDLNHVTAQLESEDAVASLDVISNLHFSRDPFSNDGSLYGRAREIALLSASYEEVCKGGAQFLLISGTGGVGKSSLVRQMARKVTQSGGFFIEGGFNLRLQDIPNLGFIQALRDLVRNMLIQDEESIQRWRLMLTHFFEEGLDVLIKAVPELAHIVGKPPETTPDFSVVQFRKLVVKFLSLCATDSHPIVLFLDNMHWADPASIGLLEELLSSPARSMLVVGTYRNDDLTESHPLSEFLTVPLDKTAFTCTQFSLVSLQLYSVQLLVSAMLYSSPDHVKQLAEVLIQKTHGNPFFLLQLMRTLLSQGWVEFSADTKEWVWDLDRIREADITENVGDLILYKLRCLPDSSRHLLHISACLSREFSFETLTRISSFSPKESLRHLFPCLSFGFLLIVLPPVTTLDELFTLSDEQLKDVRFRFLHDRVLQTVYDYIPSDQRYHIQLKIGRVLLRQYQKDQRDGHIFEILSHLNEALPMIYDDFERIQVAQLNYKAGLASHTELAFESALHYFSKGLEILGGEAAWQLDRELMVSLAYQKGLHHYYCGDFQSALQSFYLSLLHCLTALDKARIYASMIPIYISQHTVSHACDAASAAFDLLDFNFSFSSHKGWGYFEEFRLFLCRHIFRDRFHLKSMPELEDVRYSVIFEVLNHLAPLAHTQNVHFYKRVVCRMMSLCLTKGFSTTSVNVYAHYAYILMTVLRHYSAGASVFESALVLKERFPSLSNQCQPEVLLGALSLRYTSYTQAIARLEQAFVCRYTSQDILYAGYAVVLQLFAKLMKGTPLDVIRQESRHLIEFVENSQLLTIQLTLQLTYQFMNALQGTTQTPYTLDAEKFSETDFLIQVGHNLRIQTTYFVFKLLLFSLHGRYEEAIAVSAQMQPFLKAYSDFAFYPDYLLFLGLAYLDDASETSFKKVQFVLSELEALANRCPENHQAKFWLLQGVFFRETDHYDLALSKLEAAIADATDRQYFHIAAIAYEKCASLYMDQKRFDKGYACFSEAIRLYEVWGASAKAALLMQYVQEQFYFYPNSNRQLPEWSLKELDFKSVFKASQFIASEIMLPKLLENLLSVLVETAGAQTGYLILCTPGQTHRMTIEAEKCLDSQTITLLNSEPIDSADKLPRSVVNYVCKTRQTVILDHTSSNQLFLNDPYIQLYFPKSILCFPILKQTELLGIAYLENRHSSGVFTTDRLEILTLLAAQAAISLENARLVVNLEQLNQHLEDRVEAQLKTVQKALQLSTVSQTVITFNHEINSPLTTILMTAQKLAEHVSPQDPLYQRLQNIVTESKKIANILQKMRNITEPLEEEYVPGISMLKLR